MNKAKQNDNTSRPATYKAPEQAHLSPEMTFVDEREYARIINRSVASIRRDRWNGKGCRFYKFSGLVRYRMSDILAVIEAAARSSSSDMGEVTF